MEFCRQVLVQHRMHKLKRRSENTAAFDSCFDSCKMLKFFIYLKSTAYEA